MLTNEEMQHRIDYEILVDCYDDDEFSMGWFYFFEEALEFPFKATAQLKKRDGTLEMKLVKIVGMGSDEVGFLNNDFNLNMEQGQYVVQIPYSRLRDIKASEETLEAFQIWEYYHRHG